MDDYYLLEGLKRKDEMCHRELIQKYSRYVVAICLRVAKGKLVKEDIEEISADVFFKIWERAREIEIQGGSLRYYLGVVARNQTIKRLQRQGWLNAIVMDEEDKEDSGFMPEQYLLQKEETAILTQAIKAMGEPDGEIFIRRYFYEDRISEIAKCMGIKESTIRSKLSRGKKKLYNIFKERGVVKNEKDRSNDAKYRTLFARNR